MGAPLKMEEERTYKQIEVDKKPANRRALFCYLCQSSYFYYMIDKGQIEAELNDFFSRVDVPLDGSQIAHFRGALQKIELELTEIAEKIGQLDLLHQLEFEQVQKSNSVDQEITTQPEVPSSPAEVLDAADTNAEVEPIELEQNKEQQQSTFEPSDISEKINQTLSTEKQVSTQEKQGFALADKLRKSAISSLSQVIGISEKYQFIQELFKGNTERYLKELEHVNGCENGQDAFAHLARLEAELEWNKEGNAYITLIEIVERKFPPHE